MTAIILFAVLYLALGIIDLCETIDMSGRSWLRYSLGLVVVLVIWLPLKLYDSVHWAWRNSHTNESESLEAAVQTVSRMRCAVRDVQDRKDGDHG